MSTSSRVRSAGRGRFRYREPASRAGVDGLADRPGIGGIETIHRRFDAGWRAPVPKGGTRSCATD